jgi:hypothetical protein
MKSLVIFLILSIPFVQTEAQQKFIARTIKSFGAKGDGKTNDHPAFVKAANFFNARGGNGKLIINKGTYLVGKQIFIKDNPDKYAGAYTGEAVLYFRNCKNLIVEGTKGSVIKFRKGLKQGTFSPETGKAFPHEIKEIYYKPEYRGYRSTAGILIRIANCDSVKLSGLTLDGNMDQLNLGGTWGIGSNPYELEHYGMYIIDTKHTEIENCYIHHFAVDGICILNIGEERKTVGVKIKNTNVSYSGRNGISWVGGDSLMVYNSSFENSARGKISESPAAGMDIEVENNSFCTNGWFENCRFVGSKGSAVTSGSKEKSRNMIFKNCVFASPLYYTVLIDAPAHIFDSCSFFGSVLIWQRAHNEEDATRFQNCNFAEKFMEQKMYDANYLVGAEATGIYFDNCTFTAESTACYYLAAHAKTCDQGDAEKFFLNNCRFINKANTALALASTVAGIAHHSEFTNCVFTARKGYTWENNFNANCFADGGGNRFEIIQ